MNHQLLREVADWIEAHPEKYNQSFWHAKRNDDAVLDDAEVAEERDLAKVPNACGTVACVAGWATVLGFKNHAIKPEFKTGYILNERTGDYEKKPVVDWEESGKKALDLDGYEAEWLFGSTRNERTMSKVLRALADGESFQDAGALECES